MKSALGREKGPQMEKRFLWRRKGSSGEEKVLGDSVPRCLRREKGALMPREEKRCLDASREEKVPQYLGRGKFASVPWEGKRCLSASGGEAALVAWELKKCLSSSGVEKVLL